MKNKGFSLVELIIVIAIMVILAGTLAPMLIKYIGKSRLSKDVDTGASIGRAIMAAVTNDNVFEDAVEQSTPKDVNDMQGPEFKEEVFKAMGVDYLEGESKVDINNDPVDKKFYYTLDAARNRVEVYYGGTSQDYLVFPNTGSKMNK
mgnify:CR=1 FL=1